MINNCIYIRFLFRSFIKNRKIKAWRLYLYNRL